MRARDVNRRRAGLSVIAALVAVLVGGCGTGSDLSSTTASTAADSTVAAGGSTVSIVMKSLDFSPRSVNARVGERVSWLNEDQAPHNVTYVSGPRFVSSRRRMRIGARFSIRLTQPGTIHYVCTLHPWMQAAIVVSR